MRFSLTIISFILGTAAGRAVPGADPTETVLHRRAIQPKGSAAKSAPSLSGHASMQQADACGSGKLRKRGGCYSSPNAMGPRTRRGQAAALRAPPSLSSVTTSTAGSPELSPASTNPHSSAGGRSPAGVPGVPRLALDRIPGSTSQTPFPPASAQGSPSPPAGNNPNRIKMAVENGGHIRELHRPLRPDGNGPWKDVRGFGYRANIDKRRRPSDSVGGQMLTNEWGVGKGSVKADRVRADVAASDSSNAIVTVKDPSKIHYPTGQHSERVQGDTPKVFRGQGANGQLAKVKVQSDGLSSTHFEGTHQDSSSTMTRPVAEGRLTRGPGARDESDQYLT